MAPSPQRSRRSTRCVQLLANSFRETWAVPGALDALAAWCERVPAISLPRLPLDRAVAIIDQHLRRER